MEIFILILKIIGILLAVILLLVGAVLAVPVRYRVDAEIDQQKLSGRAVFSWFFHIIDCRIWYMENGIHYKLRILGIPIGANRKKGKKPGKIKKEKPASSKEIAKKRLSEEKNLSDADRDGRKEQQPSDNDKSQKEQQPLDNDKSQEEQQPSDNNKRRKGKNRKERRKTQKSKKRLFERIHRFWENLKQRFNLIFNETNRRSLVKVWRELKYLIRHFFPRRAKGELAFGMKDPSQTGQILGAISLLPFWARYRISIYPDFQTDVFYVEGQITMRGHIRLWHLLLSAVRLIKDKDIRLLLEKIRT